MQVKRIDVNVKTSSVKVLRLSQKLCSAFGTNAEQMNFVLNLKIGTNEGRLG